ESKTSNVQAAPANLSVRQHAGDSSRYQGSAPTPIAGLRGVSDMAVPHLLLSIRAISVSIATIASLQLAGTTPPSRSLRPRPATQSSLAAVARVISGSIPTSANASADIAASSARRAAWI